MLAVDEAQTQVLARCARLEAETVPLAEADGRVTAADTHALVDLPPFPSSAMDGFAIRSGDVPATLAIVGGIAAGSPAARPLGDGEAMSISTGGVVPEGADAVVPIEDVVVHGGHVEVAAIAAGANVRPRAGDVRAGDVVAPRGSRLTAARLGALAAAGVAELSCTRRPRVAVLATGSELVAPGTPLAPGQVYEANALMLEAALASVGAEVVRLPAVEDSESAHRAAIERGLEADVLVTSGGVSVGPHDLVRRIESELGVEEVFWQVAMRPGKPVAFGVRGRTLVFGLPGNPVSSLVGCELFVKPAVRALQGVEDPLPRFERGRLVSPLRRNAARDDLVRARAHEEDGVVVLEPLSGQESHMIVRASAANALVLVARGDGTLDAGADVPWLAI